MISDHPLVVVENLKVACPANSSLEERIKIIVQNYVDYLIMQVRLKRIILSLAFLSRKRKRLLSGFTVAAVSPSALLFKNNNKFNEYHMQSWECYIRCDADSSDVSVCASCRTFWRTFRGLQPNKTVLLSEHNKSLKRGAKCV